MTVSGQSPVIDTSATRIQTNYDQQMLSSIPNARDMWSLLATTPSVTLNRIDVGGSTAGTQTTYFSYGYSGQNRPLIEGINTTEGTAAAGFYLDYGSFEEVFIGAAANSAEMPNPGVLTQFVGKSGGNRPSVSLYYDYENGDIQSRNLDPEQYLVPGEPANGRTIRPDGNRLASYKNLNLGIGGPIIRDRMWGHFSYLNQQNSVAAPPAGVIQDGTPFDTKLFNYTGKATYQVNQSNKFIGYLQHGTKEQPHRTDSSNRLGAPVHITGDSTVLQASPSWVYKGEWNGTLTQNMFAEIRAGQFGYNFGLDSNTEATRYEDVVTNEITGGGRHWLNKRRRNQYTGALSFFKRQLRGRLAQLQVRRRVSRRVRQHPLGPGLRRQRDPLPEQRRADDRAPLQQRHQLAERPGDDERVRDRHVDHQSPDAERRRALRSLPRAPAGAVDPGVALQSGRTHLRRNLVGEDVQPHRAALRRDLRPERRRQDGAESQLGPFLLQPRRQPRRLGQPELERPVRGLQLDRPERRSRLPGRRAGVEVGRAGGTAGAAIDPNLVNPHTDEASFFMERAVLSDLGIRAGFVWKKDSDGWQRINAARRFENYTIPVSVVDPGPDGNAATTADNGPNLNLLNVDDVSRPANQVTETVPGYQGTYKTLEFSANKRYGNRWSMNSSFSYTWIGGVRQPLLQQPHRHGGPRRFVLALRQLSADAERADRSTSTPTGTPSSRARWMPAGACASRRS